MTTLGQPGRVTQTRVIGLFRDELGYRCLGDWTDRDANSNVEEDLLSAWLTKNGYTPAQIGVAFHKLRTEADNHSRTLYGNNQAIYNLLRYGVPVKIEAGKVTETVHLINWQEPGKNDFAIAEEVTLRGNRERRPDIVLYVNGIAVSVLELKNSRVSIGDGIRQNLSNQLPEFNAWFFSTAQFVFAGNDSEGLQYGAIGTPEKYFLKWKEDEDDDSRFKLDKYLLKMCRKDRLIELMHDFVLFDGGIKKLPRVHQYFAVKAAQRRVNENQGGIIWHTQGSGKSYSMIFFSQKVLRKIPGNWSFVMVTDRQELDDQIYDNFTDAGAAQAAGVAAVVVGDADSLGAHRCANGAVLVHVPNAVGVHRGANVAVLVLVADADVVHRDASGAVLVEVADAEAAHPDAVHPVFVDHVKRSRLDHLRYLLRHHATDQRHRCQH